MQIVEDDQQIQLVSIANCQLVHMNILFIKKVKILVLINWSYVSTQSCWLLYQGWLACFEYIVQYSFMLVLVLRSTDPHLTTSDSNIVVQINIVFYLSTSTL